MKNKLGDMVLKVGATLWQNGGWTGEEQYNDLRLKGKLGYNLCCLGFKLKGITPEELRKMID